MKNLFVNEDENAVLAQFEKEKDAEIEEDLGKQVQVTEVKQGWNAWAGEGVNEAKYHAKVDQAKRVRQDRINELKKQRYDNKMRGVVVNTQDRDKKFAHKYLVKELPHPYSSIE